MAETDCTNWCAILWLLWIYENSFLVGQKWDLKGRKMSKCQLHTSQGLESIRLYFRFLISSLHCATILQVHDYAKTQPCLLGRMKRDNYFPSYADMLRGVIKMEMIHFHQTYFPHFPTISNYFEYKFPQQRPRWEVGASSLRDNVDQAQFQRTWELCCWTHTLPSTS